MNSLLPIKLSISEFVTQDSKYSIEDLNLTIAFNQVTTYFKPPYSSLSMQLTNFPMASTLTFKFCSKSAAIFESIASIQNFHNRKSIELVQTLVLIEESTYPEKNHPLERSKSIKSVGSFKLFIEKEDTEIKNCQLCPVFEHFSTVSERALEIIVEVNKNSQHPHTRIEELSMEIHELYQNKEITQERVKNIRCLLIGVNEKLKLLELYKERFEQAIVHIEEEQKSRENMQNSFKAACEEFLFSKSGLEAQILQLEKKVKSLNEKNLALSGIEMLHNDLKSSKDLEIQTLKATILNLQKNSAPHSVTVELVNTLTCNSQFKENIAKMQKNEFNKVTEGFESVIAEYQESLSNLSHENLALTQTNNKLNKLNNELKCENENLTNENISIKNKLLEYEKKMMHIKEIEDQMLKFETENIKVKNDYKSIQEQMDKISKRYHEGTRGLYNEKKNLIENNKLRIEENEKLREKLNSLQKDLLDLQKKSNSGGVGLETRTFTFLNTQNIKLLKDIKDLCEVSNKNESDMLEEFSLVIKTIVEISGKYLMLQRLQSRILEVLKDKDIENNILRDLISKVQKGRPVYVPVRGDYIDNQLANFLNSSPTVCEIPFVRLEPGVYLIGNKRVVLRVENIGIVSKM